MSTQSQVQKDYSETAAEYNSGVADTAVGRVEIQLVKHAIGDATDLLILDLGGGSGIYAREAINAGAKRVDLVDFSPEMITVAKDTELALGRGDKIRFYEADVSKPMDHLQLGQYDMVMANWVFDHARTVDMLYGMWQNVTAYLKPGGKFVSIRASDPFSPAFSSGKYGQVVKDIKIIPGGTSYTVSVFSNPPFEFEATTMDLSSSPSLELYKKFGLTNVEVISYDKSEIVRANPEFWENFIQRPWLVVIRALKSLE